MKRFLREYWLWIVAPVVIVLGLFIAVLVTQGSDEVSPFVYKIFDS